MLNTQMNFAKTKLLGRYPHKIFAETDVFERFLRYSSIQHFSKWKRDPGRTLRQGSALAS
jgi:hypothetical protein